MKKFPASIPPYGKANDTWVSHVSFIAKNKKITVLEFTGLYWYPDQTYEDKKDNKRNILKT